MTLDKLPPLSTLLVEALDKAIPARCIQFGETLEEAHRYAGKRELVEMLLHLKSAADDNILER